MATEKKIQEKNQKKTDHRSYNRGVTINENLSIGNKTVRRDITRLLL